jgi:hypothetical protein
MPLKIDIFQQLKIKQRRPRHAKLKAARSWHELCWVTSELKSKELRNKSHSRL